MISKFVSPKALIHEGVIIGKNVNVFANCEIFGGTIIEDNVVIGYPSQESQILIKQDIGEASIEYQTYYDKKIVHTTLVQENCIIRSNSVIYEGAYIHDNFDCGHNVIIREFTTIGRSSFVYPNILLMR